MKLFVAVFVMLCLCAAVPAQAQDTKAGAIYFQQNCALCHSTGKDMASGQGPALFGVTQRKSGTAPNFNYSDALRRANLTWTDAMLDAFLADPDKAVSGTTMPVSIPNASDRANVIAYLKTLQGPAAGGRRNKFSDMMPAAVASATKRARSAGFDIWTEARPGTTHRITLSQMPRALATKNVSNPAKISARPPDAWPQVSKGFEVTVFSQDVIHPRNMVVAPNGDVFVAETAKGRITVLRPGRDGVKATTYVTGLEGPYGMAFYPSGDHPQYLYIANTLSVIRYPYAEGNTTAGQPETIIASLTFAPGGHITRSLVFTPDDRHLLVSIGAATNVGNTMPKMPPEPLKTWQALHGLGAGWGDETGRAAILQFAPDGSNQTPYAQGLRNCVGLLIHPVTHGLFCTNNERDYIGDDLPPDFFTHVKAGAFYGWPWFYIGAHADPRRAGERPDLTRSVTLPDLLIQPHSAPLGAAFYYPRTGAANAFPRDYTGDAFIALHGSGNRTLRTGQKVIHVKLVNGVPADHYEDFMTGFIVDNNSVWGKPVSIVVARDGALLVSDDVSNTIWRIAPKR